MLIRWLVQPRDEDAYRLQNAPDNGELASTSLHERKEKTLAVAVHRSGGRAEGVIAKSTLVWLNFSKCLPVNRISTGRSAEGNLKCI